MTGDMRHIKHPMILIYDNQRNSFLFLILHQIESFGVSYDLLSVVYRKDNYQGPI